MHRKSNGDAWDVERLFAEYLGGDTLAEIGRRESVSAEWIRQLFRSAGLPNIPDAHTMRQRSRDLRADLREGVVSAFMTSGSVKATANQAECSVQLARAILAEEGIEVGQTYAWKRNASRPRVSAEFCREVLVEAAERCGGRITRNRYTAMFQDKASTNGKRWPAPNTLIHRLGVRTWNEALVAAELPVLSPGPGVRGPSDGDLVAFLVQLGKRFGRPPTPKEYEEAIRDSRMPRAPAIRRRFGTWGEFVKAAGF